MKRRKFSFKKFALFLIVLIILVVVGLIGFYNMETKAVSKDTTPITVTIEKGSNYYTIAPMLEKNNLIKSEFFYKIFLKIHRPGNLVVGTYELNQAMSVAEIVETLGNKDNITENTMKITFREGLNIRQIANVVEEKAGIKSEEFINKVNDPAYMDGLINSYWFLTDEIKNPKLYYGLEGYLYPDTYIFDIDKLSIETIIVKMLNNTDKKLAPFKEQLESNTYTVHQMVTLASIIELEARSDEDRQTVSGVLYNRLRNNWSLGCDITTYYGAKKSMSELLTKAELDECNGYNTRCVSMLGLPIGPINNPSVSSINAALNPIKTDYYYFVADSERKVYFTKNANEHAAIIAQLKKEGKWIG